jgi:hypothetical protein
MVLRRGARPAAWCEHDHPKEVRVLGRECSVRCLGCGQAGPPTRAGVVAAREALLAARGGTARRAWPPLEPRFGGTTP